MNALLLLGSLMIFMALRVPVVFSLLLSSLIYVLFIKPVPIIVLAHRMVWSVESFPLLSLPLFILAADIMNSGRVSDEMFRFARRLVGHIRGGLGHVHVVVSMIFAGMSGSMSADMAGPGKVVMNMMISNGYGKPFSVGLTGATSIIGPIIPPSIQMILYGMIAEQSVGRLFVGGFIPGVIMGIFLMGWVYFFAVRRNYPRDLKRASLSEIWESFRRSFWALVTPVIIIGGIILGIFTPTEAAVVAVVWGFMVAVFIYKTLGLKDIVPMIISSVTTTALILVIMGAASVFGWLMTMENVPVLLRDLVVGATDKQWVVLLLLNVAFLILGCFFDISAIVLVFTPMVIPILKAYQIDMIHWGVAQTLNVCIGFLTPPFGVGLFILSDMTGMTVAQVTRACAPFLIPLIASLLTITYLPEVVLWLPRIVFG